MAIEILTPAVQAEITGLLVNAALAAAVAVIGFVGRAVHGWVNANKNDKNLGFLLSVATLAVQAAEQVYGSDGEAKLNYATEYVKAELARRNIPIDVDQIRTTIEAAVMAEFNYPGAVTPADAPAETDVVTSSGDQPETVVTTPLTPANDEFVDASEDVI